MNKETIIIILDSLASEYSKNFSEKEITLKARNWMMIIGDLTDEQAMSGLKKALLNPGEFMPSVGKFREYCLSGKGSESLENEALEAWSVALKTVSRVGYSSSPVFKDSSIAEAIRKMGGWKQLCGMMIDEQPFRKREFVDYYMVAQRQDKEFMPMLRGSYTDYKLIGYPEDENTAKLINAIEETVRMGNFYPMPQGKHKQII